MPSAPPLGPYIQNAPQLGEPYNVRIVVMFDVAHMPCRRAVPMGIPESRFVSKVSTTFILRSA